MDINKILQHLPHRYPFLLIDRVLSLEMEPERRLTALKNVTINEPFFQGHFPRNPVMPGVLMIEAMAQASGMLAHLAAETEGKEGELFYLVKVDRASMRESLEVRVPFLDHRVVEYAWQLPAEFKVRAGIGKWPLKQILYKYVPKQLVDRPKMGFGIPVDHWLRAELRDWAEALIDPQRLIREGYLNPQPIREKWDSHLNDNLGWHYLLWPVLMFQSWLEHYEGNR